MLLLSVPLISLYNLRANPMLCCVYYPHLCHHSPSSISPKCCNNFPTLSPAFSSLSSFSHNISMFAFKITFWSWQSPSPKLSMASQVKEVASWVDCLWCLWLHVCPYCLLCLQCSFHSPTSFFLLVCSHFSKHTSIISSSVAHHLKHSNRIMPPVCHILYLCCYLHYFTYLLFLYCLPIW